MKAFIITLKSILGSLFLIISLTIAMTLFMDIDRWGERVIKKLDVRVTQRHLGGEIKKIIDHEQYVTRIHGPVFEGPLKENKKGFVQIDWFSTGKLPDRISESVDYNEDGTIDFKVDVFTKENRAVLTAHTEKVTYLMDKASMGTLAVRGNAGGRNGLFIYHDYKEPLFLGYKMNDLDSLEAVKALVILNDQELLDQFLNDLLQRGTASAIEVTMIDKITGGEEQITINGEKYEDDGYEKVKIVFKNIEHNRKQQLEINSSAEDYNRDFKAWPVTSFQDGRSVRVLLNK